MKIDQFYSDIDKNNFYLGMVSQVYNDGCAIQIENLSWLKQRRIKEELLIPNTINYYVVVDSTEGLFIGEVYQSKIMGPQNSHEALKNDIYERVFPEMYIDIIGVLLSGENIFISPGFKTVGLTDKVYIVNNLVKEKFLESVEIKRLDKNYLTDKLGSFAKVVNIGDERVSFYPETLFDRHLMAIGTTNSGKSTTALSILDKLVLNKKKILFIDPTGEYSESFPEDDVKLLTLGKDTMLEPGKVSFTQWATLFETNEGTQPAVLADAITSLRYQKKMNKSGAYIKENKLMLDVKRDLSKLNDSDLDFDLSLLPIQILEEGVELGRDMQTYEKGSFQFNNKQWLVQKVEHKINNTDISKFFGKSKDKSNLLNELDKFMSDETKNLYINT